MKDYQKQFVIHFSGLKDEVHKFEFQIVKKFFDDFEQTDIKDSNICLNLTIDKRPRMLQLNFSFKGSVNLICDRCLDSFDFPIVGEEMLIVRFGDDEFEETDEIIILPESAYEIDIRHYIYEFINLILPIKKVHPENEKGESLCNKEIVKFIDKNTNESEVDPRWKALQELTEKD